MLSFIPDRWKHRILGACGITSLVATVFIPVLAPVLGPLGIKLVAAAGTASLIAFNVQRALAPAPAPAETPRP